MKRFFLMIITTLFLLCGLCGCSSLGDTLCTNEEFLAQFAGDGKTAEFILEGTYYTLPLKVSVLLENGWQIKMNYSTEAMEFEDVILPPDECLAFRFTKDQKTLTAEIINTTEQEMLLNEESMITGIIMSESDWAEDDFVVTGGIRMGTSMTDAKACLKDLENFDDEGYFYQLKVEKDGFNQTLLQVSGKSSVDFIQIRCEDANYYTSYQPEEVKEENANAYKQVYKEDCESYTESYEELIDALENEAAYYIKFHIAGEIVDKVAGKTILTYADASEGTVIYIVQNEVGEQYAFFAEKIASETSQIPELSLGDSVEVWGSANTLLLADGNKIPIMYAAILEKDHVEIFQADTFLQ